MSKFERVLRVVIGILVIVGVWYLYASWWALIGLVPFDNRINRLLPNIQGIRQTELPI